MQLLKKQYLKYHDVFWQLCRFGVVGFTSAFVNWIGVVFFVHFFDWHPLLANILAFFIAFNVSFVGHHYWTFSKQATNKQPWGRFLAVAILGFCLTEGLYALLLHVMGKELYAIALILTLLIVPPVTFVFSKFWAFK